MVFQTYTFGGIVDHWDEYGNWFYYDIVSANRAHCSFPAVYRLSKAEWLMGIA